MLADAILVIHFLFVLFVTGGFALILAGAARRWSWIRARRFRSLHLGAILLVTAESLAGIACPLTVWEDALRRAGPQHASFVGRWIARLLYYDFPEWGFATVYVAFALAAALAWRRIPPHPPAPQPGLPDRRYHSRAGPTPASGPPSMTPHPEQQYLDLMRQVLEHGHSKTDRTGTGTLSIFGAQMRFPLAGAFPLLTTKKLHLKSIVYELLWFLRGESNIDWLKEHGVTIWDEWADENGELGPVYGVQWRNWQASDGRRIDQIAQVVESIRSNPDSRRHIVTAWNPGDVPRMKLPPCHAFFQFYVAQGRLSCQMYQRSADIFLGVPFNIASYSLLTLMVAQVTGLAPGEFVHTLGDAHLYLNHLEQARQQLDRAPRPFPSMKLNPAVQDVFAFTYEDFTLEGYDPHPAIKAPIAV